MYKFVIIPSCILTSLCLGCVDESDPDGKTSSTAIDSSNFAEEYARENFKHLQKHPDLEKLFTDFSSISHAHAFMRDDSTRKIYRDIIVMTLEEDRQKNVLDASFATYLLRITPRDILLEAIVPELGPKGKLHGVLEGKTDDVRKRLQRQSLQGYPGEPDFRHYASYLKNHKDVELSPYLIRHMFRTAPGKALRAMIYVQYLPVPYPPLRLSKSASVNAEIRPLVYAEHVISDVIWHEQFRFDLAPEQRDKAKKELSALSKNEHWWVRLYVAEIMQQHPELRVPDVMQELKQDQHDLVKQAITRKETSRGLEGINNPPNSRPVELPE